MKALLLIDIQKGLTQRKLYEKDIFISTINRAIAKYHDDNQRVIFIQHENKQLIPQTEDWEIDDRLNIGADDWFFGKREANAFSNIALEEKLSQEKITDIVVAGLVSHGCVSYTCKGGIEENYNISLLKGAHTSWGADAKQRVEATEAALAAIGVTIVDVDDL